MLSRIIDKLIARTGPRANIICRVWSRCMRRPPLAYHGLQRCGTNCCLKCLRVLGCLPVNMFDGDRNSPTHKYFRWQANKNTIKLDKKFVNSLTAIDIEELNRIAGYHSDTRHLIMQKRVGERFISIINWGLFCGWWPDVHAAIRARQEIFDEYHEYYGACWSYRERHPGTGAILDLGTAIGNSGQLIATELGRMGVDIPVRKATAFTGHFKDSQMCAISADEGAKRWVHKKKVFMKKAF